MKLVVFLISSAAALLVSRVNAELTSYQQKMMLELQEGKIFPDALDAFEPSALMRISYGEDNIVENGMILSPDITMEAPHLRFTFPNPDSEYTFAMINLDSNSPQIVHWLSSNINSGSNEMQEVNYVGPTPSEGSDLHRIVYVLFEQADKNIDIRVQDRDRFELKRFMTDYKLTPLSAAYIYTQQQAKEVKQQNLGDLFDSVGDALDLVPDLIVNVGDILDGIHVDSDEGDAKVHILDDSVLPIVYEDADKPSISQAARLPLPSSYRRLHAPNKDKNVFFSVNGDGQYSVSLSISFF